MSAEVDEALRNALNVEVKQRYGEEVFVKNTLVLVLVERPREDGDKPDAPRFQMMLKTLQPIQPGTAARMLSEAAVQFQRQKIEIESQENQ
ncbi:hypothetical protein SEA_GUYFAGIERI_15 [Rhodococcus phage GuyFagieri]|nr:hypothetical protein SEA_GUYFAGIERI_15 [Rhodococcus phage GuyFagieri]